MNGLIRETQRWVLLLLLCALALGALSQPGADGTGLVELLIAGGVVGAVIWNLRRTIRRLSPRRGRKETPARPELPARSHWIGPRTRDQERRG